MQVPGDGQLTALRRQLGGLQYDAGGLTPAAAPLVAALLGDLLKATDSYRSLQAQAGDAGQAAQNLQYQVRLAELLRKRGSRCMQQPLGCGRVLRLPLFPATPAGCLMPAGLSSTSLCCAHPLPTSPPGSPYSQVDVSKREAGRLTAENSRLHQDLLAEADARGAQQAAATQRAKHLEAQAAEAQFAKQQALERAAGVERERDGLRGQGLAGLWAAP